MIAETSRTVAQRIHELLPEAVGVRPITVAIGAVDPADPVALVACFIATEATNRSWRPLARAEWERLIAAGVPLLPWEAARELRAAWLDDAGSA